MYIDGHLILLNKIEAASWDSESVFTWILVDNLLVSLYMASNWDSKSVFLHEL